MLRPYFTSSGLWNRSDRIEVRQHFSHALRWLEVQKCVFFSKFESKNLNWNCRPLCGKLLLGFLPPYSPQDLPQWVLLRFLIFRCASTKKQTSWTLVLWSHQNALGWGRTGHDCLQYRNDHLSWCSKMAAGHLHVRLHGVQEEFALSFGSRSTAGGLYSIKTDMPSWSFDIILIHFEGVCVWYIV